MSIFKLPDLGEGLPEADIVEWLVQEGESVKLDQPLVSMETAKAVVEVPSPFTGVLKKQYGQAGDTIETHAPLAEFTVEGEADNAGEPAAEEQAPAEPEEVKASKATPEDNKPAEEEAREDSGTVVGTMDSSGAVLNESVSARGGVKAVPAVRALARKLKVDLSAVSGTGKDGVITANDVRQAAENGSAPAGKVQPAAKSAQQASAPAPSSPPPAAKPAPSGKGEPVASRGAGPAEEGYEKLKGPRKAMARAMSQSHAEIVPTSLFDDADVSQWEGEQDLTARLIRAICQASQKEPGLNAWYDGEAMARKTHENVDVGIAVDTKDGLFVPALREAQYLNADGIRSKLNRLVREVKERSIEPAELKDYTIMLSNFGVFGGKYATPVITQPCVAIIAAGRWYEQLRMEQSDDGQMTIRNHKLVPISLTFDHRAATGGEAARFLAALIEDLNLPY
jgi:pyruvate dehydrogenase E2 component (dihydrolipoamide acetyltransferase)